MAEEAQNLDDVIFAGTSGYDDLDRDIDSAARGDTVEPETDGSESSESESATEPESEQEESAEPEAAEAEGTESAESGEQSDDKRPRQSEPRIPKHRFDEVNERRKAAEQRLAELEKQSQSEGNEPKIDFDFEAKEEAYMDAVLDGEKDKAKQIRNEIRQAEQQLYRQEVEQYSSSTREATKTELKLQETVDQLQTDYPVFDGQSDQYDENLTAEALDLFEGFKGRGYDPVTAMQRATRYVVRANGLDQPAETEQPKGLEAGQHQATKEQAAKKAEKAAKQPPQPSSRTTDESRDVMNLTEEDFDKLSEADLRRLRGDFV